MPLINLDAVLNPLPELKDHILDYIPRATTSEFGIVALGSGINVDSFGRIYLDTQEYSDRLAAIEATAASTLETTVNTLEDKADGLAASITQKLGTPNGIATLDSAGCIPSTQLPSYVDDVLEYENVAAFPATGETGKIYVETAGNTTYRWGGTGYVKITSGEVSTVAGKTGVVTLTKADVGLDQVDNTPDAQKPISTATQLALNHKINKSETYTKQESDNLVNNSISDALTSVNASLDLTKRGIANRYDSLLTYNSGERVVLANGDIVKSTIDGNMNDPNDDTPGWEFEGLSKSIYNPLNLNYTQQQLATAFTTSLNALIQKVSLSGGGTISIPDGLFYVEPSIGITLRDNIELRMGKNTILKNSPHNAANYQMIRANGVKNCSISGGVLDGNRAQNSATTGEWGMGISINSSSDISISGVVVRNTWGDGLYIGRLTGGGSLPYSENVNINNFKISNCRRQGISVISLKNGTWDGVSIDSINGTLPGAGIDFEPNLPDERIESLIINGLNIENCAGSCLVARLANLTGYTVPTTKVSITMNSVNLKGGDLGNKSASYFNNCPDQNTKGFIKLNGLTVSGFQDIDLVQSDWNGDSVQCYYDDVLVTKGRNQATFWLVAARGSTINPVGGCHVKNIETVYTSDAPVITVKPYEIFPASSLVDIKNVSIASYKATNINPLKLSYVHRFTNVEVIDNLSQSIREFSSNLYIGGSSANVSDIGTSLWVCRGSAITFFTIGGIKKGVKIRVLSDNDNLRFRASSPVLVKGYSLNPNTNQINFFVKSGEYIEVMAVEDNVLIITEIGKNTISDTEQSLQTLAQFTLTPGESRAFDAPIYNFNKPATVSYSVNTNAVISSYPDTTNNKVIVKFTNYSSTTITVPMGSLLVVAG